MALRRTAYRWTITHDDPLMSAEVYANVVATVNQWCASKPTIFSDGLVTGNGLGLIQVCIVVTRRDRWECSRRAREFARALAVRAKVRMVEVIDPEPANLPSHDHRGRRRWEAPKWSEATADGS